MERMTIWEAIPGGHEIQKPSWRQAMVRSHHSVSCETMHARHCVPSPWGPTRRWLNDDGLFNKGRIGMLVPSNDRTLHY